MAENIGTASLQGTVEERTWRITCFCENGTDYALEAHREKVLVDADGKTVATLERETRIVRRRLSEVAGDEEAMRFLGLAKTLVDRWAAEDAAPPVVEEPAAKKPAAPAAE